MTLINCNAETPEFSYYLSKILNIRIIKQIHKKGPRPFWFLLEMTFLVQRTGQEQTVVRDLSGEVVYEKLAHLGESPFSTFRESIQHWCGKTCIICLDQQGEIRGIFSATEFPDFRRSP